MEQAVTSQIRWNLPPSFVVVLDGRLIPLTAAWWTPDCAGVGWSSGARREARAASITPGAASAAAGFSGFSSDLVAMMEVW